MLFFGVLAFSTNSDAITIKDVKPGEDVFKYITRVKGSFDQKLYQQVIGAANPFKEGDKTIGVAADTDASRENARKLLANTKIKDITNHPLLNDDLYKFIAKSTNSAQYNKIKDWTMGQMKTFLLTKSEAANQGGHVRHEQRGGWLFAQAHEQSGTDCGQQENL